MQRIAILIGAIVLSSAAQARGQNPAAHNYGAGNNPVMRQAVVSCAAELHSICASPVGDAAKVRCLQGNAARLSPGCRGAIGQ